ncbi:hypothetical protein [Chryseobacterium gossypii]|uniref:hypothetical protein n=1 Tax=Chryseobacterium gossypii TaxID=3231602 RepID=UPI003523352A
MVILSEFIKEEINDHTKTVILSTINEGKLYNKVKDELIFNRYSIQFLFPKNQIIIYDDIFPEEDSLHIDIDDFLKNISNSKAE